MSFLNRAVVNTQKWVSWKLNPIPGTILDFNLAIALFIIDLLVGITGFMWLEGFAFIDAFYQTVITISTVGFIEVKKLDDNGKIFVSLYILFNIGVFAYILSVFSYYVIQGEIFKTMHLNHVKSAIEHLNNHVIVCGFGKYGKEITQHFLQHKIPFVVIDINPERIESIQGWEQEILYIQDLAYELVPPACQGKKLSELKIRQNTGANVIGFRDARGYYHINPAPDATLLPNTSFIVLGDKRQLDKLKEYLGAF